jgi:hypothetical protein
MIALYILIGILCFGNFLAVIVGFVGGFLDAEDKFWKDVKLKLFSTPAKKIFFIYGIVYVVCFWLGGGFRR